MPRWFTFPNLLCAGVVSIPIVSVLWLAIGAVLPAGVSDPDLKAIHGWLSENADSTDYSTVRFWPRKHAFVYRGPFPERDVKLMLAGGAADGVGPSTMPQTELEEVCRLKIRGAAGLQDLAFTFRNGRPEPVDTWRVLTLETDFN